MRRARAVCGLALLALPLACARPAAPRPPQGEDYLYPAPRAGELRQDEAARFEKAWRDVLTGSADQAARGFTEILKKRPGLAPAQAGFGYARLRAGRYREAEESFATVLGARPDYVPALIGAGSAAFRLGDPERALGFYKRAEGIAPSQPLATRRLAELKLQVTERRVAAARAALERGDRDAALEEYRSALEAAPEVGALRVEYANLLLAGGDVAEALAALRSDPMGDRQALLRLGELLSEQKDHAGALEAYRRLLQRDPKDAEAQRLAFAARDALELEGLPPEFRHIVDAPRITRADLAALVAVKVPALKQVEGADPDVAVDIAGSWARPYILLALAHDVMDVYPNHTFQPGAIARRGDLARAVARVLDLLGHGAGPAPPITDMSRNNLFFEAASRAVAAGLMDLTPAGAFEAWRPVSGRDATDVVEGLARLVGP
ncbi:MAG TPA: tetratricopeptide repeat protein [Vicinamibacteria bacterium]|nr:tetratricopeptide repeat protein [Vicinamibacteria bacterium]